MTFVDTQLTDEQKVSATAHPRSIRVILANIEQRSAHAKSCGRGAPLLGFAS
jgi:hypothetical protein